MTIKGIFRVQTRSDLPDTPRGVPHGKGIRPSRARHFGFTEEELDFIINYDITYRTSAALE